jgi:hypothetical protein
VLFQVPLSLGIPLTSLAAVEPLLRAEMKQRMAMETTTQWTRKAPHRAGNAAENLAWLV